MLGMVVLLMLMMLRCSRSSSRTRTTTTTTRGAMRGGEGRARVAPPPLLLLLSAREHSRVDGRARALLLLRVWRFERVARDREALCVEREIASFVRAVQGGEEHAQRRRRGALAPCQRRHRSIN
jgi:hypothetical protein